MQPLPPPPTVQWRKRDSQGEIIYKYPRARRPNVERKYKVLTVYAHKNDIYV